MMDVRSGQLARTARRIVCFVALTAVTPIEAATVPDGRELSASLRMSQVGLAATSYSSQPIPPALRATGCPHMLVFTDQQPFNGELVLHVGWADDDMMPAGSRKSAEWDLAVAELQSGIRWSVRVAEETGASVPQVCLSDVARPGSAGVITVSDRAPLRVPFVASGFQEGDYCIRATLPWHERAGGKFAEACMVLAVRDPDTQEHGAVRVRRSLDGSNALKRGDFPTFERLFLANLADHSSAGGWEFLADLSVGRAELATTAAYYDRAASEAVLEAGRMGTPATKAEMQARLDRRLAQLSVFRRLLPHLARGPAIRFVASTRGRLPAPLPEKEFFVTGCGLDLHFETLSDELLQRIADAVEHCRPQAPATSGSR